MALARRVGLGRLAVRDGACAQHLVLEAAGQSHDTVLALVLGEERGAGGVAGRGGGEAGDLEGVGVVRVRVRATGCCVCGRALVGSVCVFEQHVCGAECVRVQTDRVVRVACPSGSGACVVGRALRIAFTGSEDTRRTHGKGCIGVLCLWGLWRGVGRG